MTEPKYLIWSNYSLDYEDWREDLEAEYPELTEQEREEKMYERNSEYLFGKLADMIYRVPAGADFYMVIVDDRTEIPDME